MDGDRRSTLIPPLRGLVTDEELSNALQYAATSAETLANAKRDIERCEALMKKARAEAFARLEGPVAQREILSYADDTYQRLAELRAEAVWIVAAITSKREWAERVVSIWQSEGANIRHMGGIR